MRIYTGLDLSRKRLDFYACAGEGTLVDAGLCHPTSMASPSSFGECAAQTDQGDERRPLHPRSARARRLERAACRTPCALAPLACKADCVDAWVLAELSRRDLVAEVWLPDPSVPGERERARFRMHLVRHPHDAHEPDPPDG